MNTHEGKMSRELPWPRIIVQIHQMQFAMTVPTTLPSKSSKDVVECAPRYSEPLLDYLRQINKDIPDTSRMTPGELCAMDPVNVSIHFEKNGVQLHAVFKKLILSKDTPVFGEVVDFF